MSIALDAGMASIRQILVPIDGSPCSTAALEHAVALAVENGQTKVTALHVEAPDEFEVGSITPSAPGAREEAQREMDAAVVRAQGVLGDRVSRLSVPGDPLRTIIEIGTEGDYELIVMGTHGRVGRLRMLLGSVAEGVVRNAPCPVLTVREPGGEYQSFAERLHDIPTIAEQLQHHHT